jgi:DNA-binding response OmpR family regulator
MLGPVLLCGNDPVLLSTRKMLLTHAGFTVSICSETDIASMPQDPAIELAVMGHSMPHKQPMETAVFVRDKWPEAKILFLTNADADVVQISDDDYESGSRNPSHLILACRRILKNDL